MKTGNCRKQYLWYRLAAVAIFSIFLHPGNGRGSDFPAIVTEVALRTVILGQGGTFTDSELAELDINHDTVVDVADLVLYVSTLAARPSGVRLISPVSTVRENGANVLLEISLAADYQGTIQLATTGTAENGVDYIINSTMQVPVNGSSGQVLISFPNNDQIRGTKVLIVYLVPDPGYQIGLEQQVVLYIEDNDAVWHGLLQSGMLTRSVTLRLFRNGSVATKAVWVSDGSQSIPEGIFKDYPPDIVADNDNFSLQSRVYSLDGSDNPTGLEIQRQFILEYDPNSPGHVLDYEATISGDLTEIITFPEAGQLDRTELGTFTLHREARTVEVPEPPLLDSP